MDNPQHGIPPDQCLIFDHLSEYPARDQLFTPATNALSSICESSGRDVTAERGDISLGAKFRPLQPISVGTFT